MINPSPAHPQENRLKRLIYRSVHRGCKETDLIFAQFAQEQLPALPPESLDTYEELLEEADADIWLWLVGSQNVPRPEYAPFIELLRRYRPAAG